MGYVRCRSKRGTLVSLTIIALVLSVLLGWGSLGDATSSVPRWHLETTDGTGSGFPGRTLDNVGQNNAVVVYDGQLHMFTYDATIGTLRHDWWDGAHWVFETLDGRGSPYPGHTDDNVGQETVVTVFDDQLEVFTSDATTASLRYDWWDGAHWHFEVLDGPGSDFPGHTTDNVGGDIGAIQYAGQLHVFTYDAATASLRHDWLAGTNWHFEVLDGPGSYYPGHTTDKVGLGDIAVTQYGGELHVFTYDGTNGSLRHVWWVDSGWHFEVLDGPASDYPGHTTDVVGQNIAVSVYNTQLQVFSWDIGPILGGGYPLLYQYQSLRQDWWDGTHWTLTDLGSVETGGGCCENLFNTFNSSGVATYDGQLHVFTEYAQITGSENSVGHYWWDGRRWNFQVVDGLMSNFPGSVAVSSNIAPAIAVYEGQLHIFYQGASGTVRHAWWG